MGHRHLAGSTTPARRAWSPSDQAGALQETTPGQWPAGDHPLVHRAGKCSERRSPRGFLLFEAKRASRDYRGGLLCQRLGLDGIRGLFCQLAGSFLQFRAATTEGNRFTHSLDPSTESSLISWAYWCLKRRSASVRLKRSTMP